MSVLPTHLLRAALVVLAWGVCHPAQAATKESTFTIATTTKGPADLKRLADGDNTVVTVVDKETGKVIGTLRKSTDNYVALRRNATFQLTLSGYANYGKPQLALYRSTLDFATFTLTGTTGAAKVSSLEDAKGILMLEAEKTKATVLPAP